MTLLNPTYLWALLGLAVPIIIHFWSNKSGKTIKVGSVQFLKESESSQSRSIRLNELTLLLLRLMVLTLLVFILAEPTWRKATDKTALTYLVEPSLLEEKDMVVLLDSLSEDYDVKLLVDGFPEYDGTITNELKETPEYWRLSQQFEKLKTDSIVVFTEALQKGVTGARPEIGTKTTWITVSRDNLDIRPLAAYKTDDNVQVISAESHSEYLIYNQIGLAPDSRQLKSHQDSDSLIVINSQEDKTIPLIEKDVINIQLVDDGSTNNPKRLIVDALKAIEAFTNHRIEVGILETFAENPDAIDLLVWNSTSPLPQNENKQLLFRPNELATRLIEKSPDPNQWYLTTELNSENIIDQHFAEQLMALLDIKSEVRSFSYQYDRRQVSRDLITPNYKANESRSFQEGSFSLSKWLWLLLIPLLISERLISKFRKQ